MVRQPDTAFSAVPVRMHEAGLLKGQKYSLDARENKMAFSRSLSSLDDFFLTYYLSLTHFGSELFSTFIDS